MIILNGYNGPEREIVTGPKQMLIGRHSCQSLPSFIPGRFYLFLDKGLVGKKSVAQVLESIDDNCEHTFYCEGEPRESDIMDRVRYVHDKTPFFVAIGGGSTIDAAKAMVALVYGGQIRCRDREFDARGDKLIAVPTTVSSGSEVSRFAVVRDESGQKITTRSWDLRPDLTILDPQLLLFVPSLTLLTWAFDAFNHFEIR